MSTPCLNSRSLRARELGSIPHQYSDPKARPHGCTKLIRGLQPVRCRGRQRANPRATAVAACVGLVHLWWVCHSHIGTEVSSCYFPTVGHLCNSRQCLINRQSVCKRTACVCQHYSGIRRRIYTVHRAIVCHMVRDISARNRSVSVWDTVTLPSMQQLGR